MHEAKDLMLDDYYKLRITSKRLNSGRYQVKFFATVKKEKELYGYVLVEAEETLKSVTNRIKWRLMEFDQDGSFANFHLFSNSSKATSNLIIFE